MDGDQIYLDFPIFSQILYNKPIKVVNLSTMIATCS